MQILIADFFLVCLALLLLVVGLGERVALDSSVRRTAAIPTF